MFRILFDRMFLVFFIVWLVISAVTVTIVNSMVQASAFEGEPAWSWDYYGESLGALFGDTVSLLALVGGLAIFAGALWVAGWLADHRRVGWSRVWYAIGMFVGGGLLFGVVDWSSFGFGWTPVLVLIAVSAVMALIFRVIAYRLAPVRNAGVPAAAPAAAAL